MLSFRSYNFFRCCIGVATVDDLFFLDVVLDVVLDVAFAAGSLLLSLLVEVFVAIYLLFSVIVDQIANWRFLAC